MTTETGIYIKSDLLASGACKRSDAGSLAMLNSSICEDLGIEPPHAIYVGDEFPHVAQYNWLSNDVMLGSKTIETDRDKVFILSHELRHKWQRDTDPKLARSASSVRAQDELGHAMLPHERDANAYAIANLKRMLGDEAAHVDRPFLEQMFEAVAARSNGRRKEMVYVHDRMTDSILALHRIGEFLLNRKEQA